MRVVRARGADFWVCVQRRPHQTRAAFRPLLLSSTSSAALTGKLPPSSEPEQNADGADTQGAAKRRKKTTNAPKLSPAEQAFRDRAERLALSFESGTQESLEVSMAVCYTVRRPSTAAAIGRVT